MWRQLSLILWKNLIIRKRHWLLTFTEILIPILLFTLVAYGRSKISGMNKVHIEEPTYYDISTVDDIYSHLDVGELSLWYSPYTDFTEKIIAKVQDKLQIRGDAVKEFASKDDLLKHFGKNCSSLVAAIIFKGNDPRHLNYDLTIYDKYFTWNTDKLFIPMFVPEEAKSSKYVYKGFAALQVALDISYMELYLNKGFKDVTFSLQEFPDPPRTVDSGLSQLFIYFLPLITIFSFIFLCPAVLQRVGEEKYSGTKEYMKMVGLKSSMIWLGWFIHALITNLFSIIIIVILMKVPFWGVSYPPIEHSDGTVLFVFLFLYCMAAVTFCFLIASIFNTPSIATVIGILLWIFSYFIPQTFINSHEYLPWKFKIPFALFPNMALHYGYSSISVYEMREIGIQWYNLFQSGSGDENDVTMGNVYLMLIFDMITFMLLTLYIENVKPGEYGIAKSYSFPLINLKNFVKKCFQHRIEHSPEHESLGDKDLERGKTPCIQICNLRKKFYNHVAVNDLNMDIYKNQITVLLGQNGAGKTTTMSILTGMINATSGYVVVNGKDIKKHTDDVRKLMGLCPQHNLLFPDLTVVEHLQFFAMLRGSSNADNDAKEMLKTLGIGDKENDRANTLSGGMKRKLCLGMALVGNSEVLILDEPTSGMDPESRRKIWDLLLEYRKSKTILITTHFMEEADILGDWIAIMANGHLQCYDTPIRLKTKYNTGYHLSLLLESKHWIDSIKEVVKQHFSEAELIRETDDTITYVLPLNKSDKVKYKDLIVALEGCQKRYQIIDINLNLTTLNDVFLKAKDEIDGHSDNEIDGVCNDEYVDLPRSQGIHRQWNHFAALIKKRFYFLRKKYYWYFPAILVTICIFLLAIWLALSNNNYYEGGGPSLNLTLNAYGKANVYYGGKDSTQSTPTKIRKLYSEAVLGESGHPLFQEDVSNGIIQAGKDNIAFYKRHMIVAAEFNSSSNGDEIVVNSMFSSEALHSVPISINLAMNAIAKALLNESFSISISNTPLKPLYSQFAPSELSVLNVTSVWLILIPISMFFFMSNFIMFPNTEVSTDFIQIQTIAGMKTCLYWLTNLVFDLIFSLTPLFILFSLMCLLNLVAYNSAAFQGAEICTIFVIFATYIFVALPFSYLLSYRKTITGGFTLLIMLGIFTGIIPTLVIIAMEFSHDAYYMKVANCFKHVFLTTCPQFALSYISVKFSRKYVDNFNWKYMDPNKRDHICNTEPTPCCLDDTTKECYNFQSYYLNDESGIQWELLEMFISFIIYFIILLFLNTKLFKKMLHFLKYFSHTASCLFVRKSADNNVQEGGDSNVEENGALLVKNLTKSFGKKAIVKNLKLQLKKNKCFGLLGVNGAGKSTTFRMLTKYLFFDKGDIVLSSDKEDISITNSEYCEKIGYCLQEDCLNYFLTGRELLRTMAYLKGYSGADANQVTEHLLKHFGLQQYADKPCLEYSGGNKRKLSTCLAFLGSPKVILLDEPTSGVDPASRRTFWNILSSFKKIQDTSFLLCSHSMEECENLCDEIGIMKNGEIKDQGSLLALKNKYQKGFKIAIKLKSGTQNTDKIKNDISQQLGADLLEEYAESLTYQVRDGKQRLSGLFTTLEELKNTYEDIEDYVISQISLEDIFLSVAEKD